MKDNEILREVQSKFEDLFREAIEQPEFRDKIFEFISKYIIEKYGSEISIKEYFEENIFK